MIKEPGADAEVSLSTTSPHSQPDSNWNHEALRSVASLSPIRSACTRGTMSKTNGLAASTILTRPTGRTLGDRSRDADAPDAGIAASANVADRPPVGIVSAMRISNSNSVPDVPIDTVVPNPDNPRSSLGDLSELADSIKAKGILQPLVVTTAAAFLLKQPRHREIIGNAEYVIIAGHRRHGASKLAELPTVPIIVREDLSGSEDILESALIENIHRQAFAPLEEARGLQILVDAEYSQRKITQRTGISQPQVSKRLALLKLPLPLQHAMGDEELSVNAALTLGQLPPDEIVPAFEAMKANGWNARRAVEESVAARAAAEAIASAEQKAQAENIPLIDPREAFGAAELEHRLYEPAEIESARSNGALVGEATRDGLRYFTRTPAKKQGRTAKPADKDIENKAHKEALAARTRAGAKAVAALPQADEVRLSLAHAYLAGKTPHAESLKLTHSWLGERLGMKTDDPQDWVQSLTAKDDVIHAAWAMTIAARELNTRWARGAWTSEAFEYVTYLQKKVGYTPTAWELMNIESANPQTQGSDAQEASND